jgi:Carboxypeptidase regulatory-like domain
MLLAALLLAGCSNLATDAQPYGTIDVNTVRSNGDPVPGVQLLLYTGVRPMAYGTTGMDGKYLFRFVPRGEYGVKATPPDGYGLPAGTPDYVDRLDMAPGQHESVTFTYLPACEGSIQAFVQDSTGAPVQGAGLTLYDAQSIITMATSDANGTYTFTGLTCTTQFGVSVQAPAGYSVVQQRGSSFFDGLSLTDGEVLTVTFILNAAP